MPARAGCRRVPQSAAAATAARISASEYWMLSNGSKSDDTPPPAMILIWLAPSINCSRTRRRTSASPSAMAEMPACSATLSVVPAVRGRSERWRKSPCPDV